MTVVLAVGAIAAITTLAGVCWLLYGLLRQNGRLLMRVEALETALDQLAMGRGEVKAADDPSLSRSRINRAGLAAGTTAPGFRLPLLDGGHVSLADYSGRRVLLVFSDPSCGPCMSLLPRLEAAARHAGVAVLVISRGSAEANRTKRAQLGLSLPIALQAHWEISRLYCKFSTPMAYLIDERGRTAAEVASGGAAILALLSNAAGELSLGDAATHPPASRLTH
jgi:peroxiredoxin